MSCTEHLVKLLGTYKVFDWNCQYMHWVVTGPVFDNFHAKMQEYYEYSREAVDQLGERVQMLA
jgi:DNA-binding ferritin-like protein